MQLKLKDMQNKYLSYVGDELDQLANDEKKLRFLREYLIEKQELYQIYHNDLITNTTDIEILKDYLKHQIADLYWLFVQRDKVIEEEI